MMLTSIPAILVGIVLLILGRKLFWLFVAATGFIVGTHVAAVMFEHQAELIVISALILGAIGIMVAILLQKAAITAAGFLAGGYFAMTLLKVWALQASELAWISFLVGGVVGALLMNYVFDWALIVLSSISGAYLIIHSVQVNQSVASAFFVAMFIVGIVVQARLPGPKAQSV